VLFEKIWTVPFLHWENVLYLPDHIRDELIAIEAVIDNAGNPTNAREHDTIIAQPDAQLGHALRPDTRISAYMLRAQNALNIDPPVLYMRLCIEPSNALADYLKVQTRLQYTYSVDEDGFRVTLPKVESERKILLVGDSVPFGVGVNDDVTIASHLQQMVGESYRVINAGVGDYSARQALQVAHNLTAEDRYEALIYVTSQNDFMMSGGSYSAKAKEALKEFAALKDKFSDRVIVLVVGYMEYMLHDILLEQGWLQSRIDRSHALFMDLPLIAQELGLEYVDSIKIFEEYMQHTGTIFSKAALYVDHAHLSPLGNRLAAERLYYALKNKKVGF
jgi:lysophospholipase L1-like esterase